MYTSYISNTCAWDVNNTSMIIKMPARPYERYASMYTYTYLHTHTLDIYIHTHMYIHIDVYRYVYLI